MAEIIKSRLLEKLKGLQRKEEEINGLLEAVDIKLHDMGYFIEKDSSEMTGVNAPNTGICINGKLSFRGKQKAEEYFNAIDCDKDGFVNYEDLRAMKAFSSPNGIVLEPEFTNWEGWKQFMTDHGIAVTPRGEIDLPNFIKYRELIEPTQPLSKELAYIHMAYLPDKLVEWQKYKTLIAELAALKHHKKTPAQKLLPPTPEDECMSFDELSFILSNSGLGFTKPEIAAMMLQRVKKKRLMADLIRKYSKLNLSDGQYAFVLDKEGALVTNSTDDTAVKVVVEDIVLTEPKQFLPWVFTNPLLIDPKELYRKLLCWKYSFFRGVRWIEGLSRQVYNFAVHMNDRLTFRDFHNSARMPRQWNEVSTLKCGILIGDEANRDGGLSGNWKLTKLESPEQLLKKLKLPTDSGSTLIFDFLYHKDVQEKDEVRCVETLRYFISHHLEKELKNNPQFGGIYVQSTVNENDNSKVLRVSIAYKRIVSLDGFMEHMLIPFKVWELVPVFVGDFRSNIDLVDWVKNKALVVNDAMALSFDITLGIKRSLLVDLFERVCLALKAGVTKEQASLLDSAAETSTNNDYEDEKNRRLFIWKRLAPYFPTILKACEFVAKTLRCLKGCSIRFRYTNIAEYLNKWGHSSFLFRMMYPEKVVHRLGFVKDVYDQLVAQYMTEFGAIYQKLKRYLEMKKAADDAKRREDLIHSNSHNRPDTSESQSRQQTMEQLKRLGIDTEETNLFDDDHDNPLKFIDNMEDERLKQDILGMIMVEHLQKNLVSLQSVDLFMAKSRLSLAVQGCDFFELIPPLPSMQKVKDNTLIKKK